MYTCTISLPGVAANNLCGPTWGVSVAYRPLNATDVGFGIGWSLTTTRYDGPRKRLSLSSGESFVVDTFVDNKATFKDRKLRTFDFIRVGVDGNYRIVHKSGMTELLKVLPGSGGVAALHEVRSPEGYAVMLDITATNGVVRLRGIVDGTGRQLVDVAYERTRTLVTLQPGTAQAAVFTFRLVNDRLVGIDLPEGYGDGWLFGYESTEQAKVLDLLLLKSTTVPTGGREEVDYQMEGHQLPGPESEPLYMPRVVTFHRYPGHGQPEMKTGYTYSVRNFFGNGKLRDWMDDEDNLYRVVMPPGQHYEYTSTETQYGGDTALRTVVRTFNRFHLMTSERSSQDGCIKEVTTIYGDDASISFEAQPPWCQLPCETRTRYVAEDQLDRPREDTEAYTYDVEGNRREHRDADGALETYEYYLSEGEEGCPPDPLGFVRCLKQKRVVPPKAADGPVRVTRYRYDIVPSLITGAPGHLQSVSEAIHHEVGGRLDLVPVSQLTEGFCTDRGSDHGRLVKVVTTVGGVDATTEYVYVQEPGESVLVVVETRSVSTGKGDELVTTARSARSLQSGQTVMEQGPDNVVTRFTYDAIGRMVTQSLGEGTPFAAATARAHALSHEKSWQEHRSVTGVRIRTELDGLGRVIRRVAVNWLGDGNEHEIWRVSLDAFGRMSSETTTDYKVPLASGELGELSAATNYTYDSWGNCATSVGPDGIVMHVRIDPVARTEETWSEAPGTSELASRSRATYGSDGRLSRIDRLTPEGTPHSWRSYVYDGWGRCVTDTESGLEVPERETRYRYDDFDRLVETVLPDRSVVYRRYATHSDDDLVEVIGIRHKPPGAETETDAVLGYQAFDGLGRRVLLRSGIRETRFVYFTPRASEPDEIILPSGEVLSCTYEEQLHRPTSISDRWKSVDCHFDYHPLLGKRVSSSNALGRQETEYFATGKVKTERFVYGVDSKAREATYAYTLLGMPASYTSVDGELHSVSYDELGRVAAILNETLRTSFFYDEFSRLRQIGTHTVDGERSMVVSLAYDALGREMKRVLVARSGPLEQTQTMTHSYRADDKIMGRTWLTSEGQRDESYGYDLRGRLVTYVCNGVRPPRDPSGAAIESQRFVRDALDNILTLETTFADAGCRPRFSTFHHADDDPTQLIRIEHLQGQSASTVRLAYDACGNLEYDECQRILTYDAMGRLSRWEKEDGWQNYRYDPSDRVGAIDSPAPTRFRYYRNGQIAREEDGVVSSSYHFADGLPVAQSTLDANGKQTVLLGSDAQGSVVSEAGAAVSTPAYLAYGYRPDDEGASDIAYAGELKERDVGWYLMASYRAYNPVLMRFHSPDANSPFGHGGLNAYAYVSGDPVNRIDPSGEGFMDWLPVLVGAVGTAIGVALSFGTLAPAAAALWAGAAVTFTQAAAVVSTGLGVVSVATTAGSIALNKAGHHTAGGVLGWMSAGYGVGSAVTGIASVPAIGRAVSSRLDKVQGAYRSVGVKVGKWQYKLQHAGGMNSKSADLGSRGAARGQPEVELAVEAVEDVAAAPRPPPRSAAMDVPAPAAAARSRSPSINTPPVAQAGINV
jgi:RHS repeat-associated protein